MRRALLLPVLLALGAGCTVPTATVLPAPITLSLDGGAISAPGLVEDEPGLFTTLVDTGTPLTAFDDHSGGVSARLGRFRLYSAVPEVPRLELRDIEIYDTPLRSIGVGAGLPVGGVLGGDNLERFVVGLDYRGGPAMTLTRVLNAGSCELANDCDAVFPFTLAGGQNTIQIGGDLYSYPPTRVILDACLEPLADPLSRDEPCTNSRDSTMLPNPPYMPSGVDVKVMIATGFPGLAISSGAFDRLRGQGAAAQVLASAPVQLHLIDPDDDGPNATGLTVGATTLGGGADAALALVSRELYYGPCAELARSRRMRRFRFGPDVPPSRLAESACLQTLDSHAPFVQACISQASNIGRTPAACDDNATDNSVASILEVEGPVPVYVMPDTAPLLQSVNADVRPQLPTVEVVIGTEVLKRLVSTIDYPYTRFVARCADATGCLTYPRFVNAVELGANCASPQFIPLTDGDGRLAGGRCPAAP